MNSPTSDVSSRVLLVEGPDDEHVIQHTLLRSGSAWRLSIRAKGGDAALLDSVSAEIVAPGLAALGIVLDADDDTASRWNSVAYHLREAGIDNLPAALDPDGVVIPETEDSPRIGVWLMPDNLSPGQLEDFVRRMIPESDPVWPLSEAYVEGIPPEHREFGPTKVERAKIHAWLATREEPRLMGAAIRTRDLEIDGALCVRFIRWLDRLFG